MRAGWGRAVRVAVPIVVALVVTPIYSHGWAGLPWHPRTIDLSVYRYGVELWLSGGDVLGTAVPNTDLVFTYPPSALFVFMPLVVLPWRLLQLVWTVAGALVLYDLVRRLGRPTLGARPWAYCLITAGLIALCEPVRATLILGQVNLFLLALVLFDLALLRDNRLHGNRWVPTGVLSGIATAVKLTPGIFAVFLAFAREWRALRAMVIAGAVMVLGAALAMPEEMVGWVRSLIAGDTRAGNLDGQINQSVIGAVSRVSDLAHGPMVAALVASILVGLAGAYAGALWYARDPVLGVSIAAVGALMASPISWDHHFVWVVPLGFALAGRGVPGTLRITGYAFTLWLGAGLYRYGAPERGISPLPLTTWELVVGAVGPALGVLVVVVALLAALRRRADWRACPAPVQTSRETVAASR